MQVLHKASAQLLCHQLTPALRPHQPLRHRHWSIASLTGCARYAQSSCSFVAFVSWSWFPNYIRIRDRAERNYHAIYLGQPLLPKWSVVSVGRLVGSAIGVRKVSISSSRRRRRLTLGCTLRRTGRHNLPSLRWLGIVFGNLLFPC